jgi:hypothetical protein
VRSGAFLCPIFYDKNVLTFLSAYDIMKGDVEFTINTVFSEEIYLEESDETPFGRYYISDRER